MKTISTETAKKALTLRSKKIMEKTYLIGYVISFNEIYNKWECSCFYNQNQHKPCSHLAKFYMDHPEVLKC